MTGEKMAEDIDRGYETIKKWLNDRIKIAYNKGYADGMEAEAVHRNLCEQETKGKWIATWEDGIFKCSECNAHRPMKAENKENFCPNCGADMREVEE